MVKYNTVKYIQRDIKVTIKLVKNLDSRSNQFESQENVCILIAQKLLEFYAQ